MDGADTQAVFEPPCAACHLDSGVGKSGKALYESVCAMCHTDMKIHTKNPEALLTMIFSGNAHIGMPAFGEFLTKKQIHSLIQILSKK